MGFFGSLFGSKVSVASLQKATQQKRFADARYLAAELAHRDLSPADRGIVSQLGAEAGDALARLNLTEAVACQRNGDAAQAAIHFELALEQVHSAELKAEIEQARHLDVSEILAPEQQSTAGCAPSSAKQPSAPAVIAADEDSQMELILTAYPEAGRAAYLGKSALFKKAFLLAHEGRDDAALSLFEQIEAAEQDSCYWFELGSLYARCGEPDRALFALEKSLEQNPEPLLSLQALVDLLLETDQSAQALTLINDELLQGRNRPFCHAQLAVIHAHQQNWKDAAQQVHLALAAGFSDAGFFSVAASVLERDGQLLEAEMVLKKLPTGGCKGGISPLLAEFYLRHGREPEKVFASFNAALRQEPDNPRWKLRLAQSCLARGWSDDGVALLRELAADPEVSSVMQQEIKNSLEKHNLKI